MKFGKTFLKSTLLLGSVFVLAACGANNNTTETTVADTTVEVTTEEVTEVETTEVETTEVEEATEEETTEAEEATEEETTEAEEATEEETTEEEATTEVEEETTEATEEEVTEEETTQATEEDDTLKDGTYTVVGNEDERGWTVKHTIEVKDGKIISSDFDYYNAEGERKSEDEEYNKNMEEKAGVSSKDAVEQLNNALVETQSAEVDVVTGATSTSDNFAKSSAALLAKAVKGDTEESNFEDAALVDGEYTLESTEDERGWAHQFTIVVKDGKVTESNYDMVDKDGNLKSEDAEYNKAMEEKAGASFKEAVDAFNSGLVEKQNTEDIEVVSGATSTYDSFVEYAKLLLEAAAKGETETIKVELAE